MFDNLSTEIKKMIFVRIHLMDLYEVSRVSQEWWALTMAICNITSDKYFNFLNYQVKFCNEMMPQEQGWEVWMFLEFTDDKSIKLFDPPDEKMIEYLQRKNIMVRTLICRNHLSILTNLKTTFPHLKTLKFILDEPKYDGKPMIQLPKGLEHLSLCITFDNRMRDILHCFEGLECVNDLCITDYRTIYFDSIRFDNLKILHLNISNQSTDEVKSLVTGSKNLSIVSLDEGHIDEEWLGLFPTNIKKIKLACMQVLGKACMQVHANITPIVETWFVCAFVERLLMKFVCQDWTKIHLFEYEDDFNPYKDVHKNYLVYYLCRPQTLKETIDIKMYYGKTPIGLLDSGNLQLKVLKFEENRDSEYAWDIVVPQSVDHFVWKAKEIKAIHFGALFEDNNAIKTLRINSDSNKQIQFSDFPHAANLVSLKISFVDHIILESILRNCPCLKQLSLDQPKEMTFSKLPADLKSSSVKQLAITEPKDFFTNILRHFPFLVDLRLENVNMETVTIPDLAQLTSVEFVRMSFVNVNDLVPLSLMVLCLDHLSFSHIIIGYSSDDEELYCVMGGKKAFFKRYLASESKTDLTEMNIQCFRDCFHYWRLFYFKGVSGLHLKSLAESYQTLYDVQEFIEKASVEIQTKRDEENKGENEDESYEENESDGEDESNDEDESDEQDKEAEDEKADELVLP